MQALYDIALKLSEEGPLAEAAFIGNLHTFSGFDMIRAWEDAFIPAEQLDRYDDSIGYQPDKKAHDA